MFPSNVRELLPLSNNAPNLHSIKTNSRSRMAILFTASSGNVFAYHSRLVLVFIFRVWFLFNSVKFTPSVRQIWQLHNIWFELSRTAIRAFPLAIPVLNFTYPELLSHVKEVIIPLFVSHTRIASFIWALGIVTALVLPVILLGIKLMPEPYCCAA